MQPYAQANWNPLDAASEAGESEMMDQLLSSYSLTSATSHEPSFGFGQPLFWSENDAGTSYSYSCSDNGSVGGGSVLGYNWPQLGCSGLTGDGAFVLPPDVGSYHHLTGPSVAAAAANVSSAPADHFCVMEEQTNDPSSLLVSAEYLLEEPAAAPGMNEESNSDVDMGSYYANPSETAHVPNRKPAPKRKLALPEQPDMPDAAHHKDHKDSGAVNPRKKPRTTGHSQNNGKLGAQSKKASKAVRNGDAEEGSAAAAPNGQASSSYSSEDDSSASQEMNGGAASSGSKSTTTTTTTTTSAAANGKTRAGRGSATDPQSLYARKRRERINERLKILQNLVPNGTKVDISTMLEEAVQYVKFLQLQIKLLSSDDLWMYAPIAYNGMNIGLDLKIFLPQ